MSATEKWNDIAVFSEEWIKRGWISKNPYIKNRYTAFRTKVIDELFPITKAGVDGWTCYYVFEKYPTAQTARAFLQFTSERFDKDTWVKYNIVNQKFKTNNRDVWEYHRLVSWKINLDNPNGLKAELERFLLEVIPEFERKLTEYLSPTNGRNLSI